MTSPTNPANDRRSGAPDFHGKTVLVTGGTKGIGRAIGLAFGALGARCVLTHKWGTAPEHEVHEAFASAGGPAPLIVRADVSSDEDTAALFEQLKAEGTTLEAIVSNVSFSFVTNSVDDYRKRSLMKSLEYSAWPLVSYTTAASTHLGLPPRYVVGISSPGPDAFHTGYDFAASAKSVMEVLARYMSDRMHGLDTRINIVRPGGVFTESLDSTFGDTFKDFALRLSEPQHYFTGEDIAGTIVALCSGWMDGMRGQVLNIDRGTRFFDGTQRLFEHRQRYGV
jgi:NAD(P)-dependent dehydrogenase (short-subunit alcohol dehydrogenase family)